MENEIKHISDFLEKVESINSSFDSGVTIVFRGEPEIYERPCFPNLFREKILENNLFFEKNQFDEMTANHLSEGNSYLEKAIDAQHGGFPSRLLDVTYNCLVALYFAVTPFYHQKESEYDNKDGMVYIFPVEKMYCPTGNNINKTYDMLMNRSCDWMVDQPIFQKNHKLIDHIKLNSRIIAQQGAFILFQGDEAEEIPYYQYQKIAIKGENKATLRKELKNLCGIHTGSIYPEKYNRVEEIIEKSNRLNSREFTLESELELVMQNLKKCLQHYDDTFSDDMSRQRQIELVMEMEKNIFSYKDGLLSLNTICKKDKDGKKGYKSIIEQSKKQYNELLRKLLGEIEVWLSDDVEISTEELLFTNEES